MNLEFKELVLEIKELNENGTFKGVASPFNNIDNGMDRVRPSIATRNNGKKVSYLWQHDTREPIGEAVLYATEKGMEFDGKFYLETLPNGTPAVPNAYKAYVLAKNGRLKNSIGYKTLAYEYVKEGADTVRDLIDIDIMEVSAVTFPMNDEAVITSVKMNNNEKEGEDVDLKERMDSMEEKFNSAFGKLDTILNSLGIDVEEKEFLDAVEEFKSFVDMEIKAGRKLSKANKVKIKDALNLLAGMLEDGEGEGKEEPKEDPQDTEKQKKENNDKIELKADELELLKAINEGLNNK